jgi:hypothetical protein
VAWIPRWGRLGVFERFSPKPGTEAEHLGTTRSLVLVTPRVSCLSHTLWLGWSGKFASQEFLEKGFSRLTFSFAHGGFYRGNFLRWPSQTDRPFPLWF